MEDKIMTLDELIEKYYKEFCGLPNNNPIVRQNIKADAFALVVLDILFGVDLGLSDSGSGFISSDKLAEVTKYIVAPPDGGIDIVVEKENGDECEYAFIQVKTSDLPATTIKECFNKMRRTIKSYLSEPNTVSNNLFSVLKETQFDHSFEKNVTYFVVHYGENKSISDKADNEVIITKSDLERFWNDRKHPANNSILRVSEYELKSDMMSNFSMYLEDAFLVNIRGLELAELARKYYDVQIGRSTLFGQNLRESFGKKSKTYGDMKNTIETEPEMFWYYNNGITIIAEDYDIKAAKGEENKADAIILKKFSIINGAQTTSALARYLEESTDEEIARKKLKKVFVFARILKVKEAEKANDIAKYNNTQNPISSRDLISNNPEQRRLAERLIKDTPSIYMEIRSGQKLVQSPRILQHRRTTNEDLAQLAFAGFFKQPYTAKDKKKALFAKDYSKTDSSGVQYIINEYYDMIFKELDENGEGGILFKKSNSEIDELLFIKHLYKLANKKIKNDYKVRIAEHELQIQNSIEADKEILATRISNLIKGMEISNISLFYVITYYYIAKTFVGKSEVVYNYELFYNKDSDYKTNLLQAFIENFMNPTIKTISVLSSSSSNAPAWIRTQKSQQLFITEINDNWTDDSNVQKFFSDFAIVEQQTTV